MPPPPGTRGGRLRRAAAAFWLGALFRAAPRYPRLVRGAGRFLCPLAFRCSPVIRSATTTNARRVLGPGATPARVEAVARGVLDNFYRFCCDVGAGAGATPDQLLARIEATEGREHYDRARAAGRGVIVVTAHMGSFEVGMAALRRSETKPIHVVFRRDAEAEFERSRSMLRRRLGVVEAPVDEGWTVWIRLRDALRADEAVVLQGDRVMPGQKGQRVPFLGGHILLPTGPVKLAAATGAPIVPIFSVRSGPGGHKVRVLIEPLIEVAAAEDTTPGGRDPLDVAMAQWASVLERYVRTYSDQWLLLQPALCEDAGG